MTRLQQIVIGILALDVIAVYSVLWLMFTVPAYDPVPEENQVAASDPVPPAPPSPSSTLPTIPSSTGVRPTATIKPMPLNTRIQVPVQFLSDYLQNHSYPNVVEATPWTNTTVNRWQYSQELGGVTLWDYFSSKFGQGYEEDWSSSRYGWLDDQGEWQTYRKERIRNARGQEVVTYVIVDRFGTGVVDQMVFTHYSVDARPSDANPDLAEWGDLARLGRLRIEVDEKIAYDVPIEDWFSGNALCLSADLAKLFFWRYRDFGSNGSIVPIPYQNHIKISVYGGVEKPKWFTFTGVMLPKGTPVKPFSGCLDAATQDAIRSLSPNVTNPESYIDQLGQVIESQDLRTGITGKNVSDSPTQPEGQASRLELSGQGTLTALQFRVPKQADITALDLQVKYGTAIAINMPLMAFFSDEDRIVKHRSTPLGVIDDPRDPNGYLFYCNYPLPYQDGITIEVTTRSQPVNLQVRYARSAEVAKTQLRVVYDDFRSHPPLTSLGPDYTVTLPGSGKLVGVVLATRDQRFDSKTIPGPPPDVFQGTIVFPMGYMESNVTLRDGRGLTRIYSGLEDFADGGYVFDSDQGSGAKNLPFAGVLAFSWKPPESGYFTMFRYFNDLSAFRFKKGLTLSFQHGTWKNTYPLRYGVAVFYYSEIN